MADRHEGDISSTGLQVHGALIASPTRVGVLRILGARAAAGTTINAVNSKRGILGWFPLRMLGHSRYRCEPEAGCFSNNRFVLFLTPFVYWLLPPGKRTKRFVCLRRK